MGLANGVGGSGGGASDVPKRRRLWRQRLRRRQRWRQRRRRHGRRRRRRRRRRMRRWRRGNGGASGGGCGGGVEGGGGGGCGYEAAVAAEGAAAKPRLGAQCPRCSTSAIDRSANSAHTLCFRGAGPPVEYTHASTPPSPWCSAGARWHTTSDTTAVAQAEFLRRAKPQARWGATAEASSEAKVLGRGRLCSRVIHFMDTHTPSRPILRHATLCWNIPCPLQN